MEVAERIAKSMDGVIEKRMPNLYELLDQSMAYIKVWDISLKKASNGGQSDLFSDKCQNQNDQSGWKFYERVFFEEDVKVEENLLEGDGFIVSTTEKTMDWKDIEDGNLAQGADAFLAIWGYKHITVREDSDGCPSLFNSA